MSPIFLTPHFTIRPFEKDDLNIFAQYRAVPSIAQYQSWQDYTYQDACALFESMDYSCFGTIGQWFQLAIADKTNNQLRGDLALHFIDQHQVEIGFTLSSESQGKGIAYEALCGLLNYLFRDLNKHRVFAITDTRNISAYRLLEKTGFRKEAHYRENTFFKGAWGDEYLFARLQSEQVSRLNR